MIFHESKVTFKGVGTPKKIWGGYSDGSICEKLYLKKNKNELNSASDSEMEMICCAVLYTK